MRNRKNLRNLKKGKNLRNLRGLRNSIVVAAVEVVVEDVNVILLALFISETYLRQLLKIFSDDFFQRLLLLLVQMSTIRISRLC